MALALTDTHCHLDFPDFAADLDGVLARAAAAGVGRCITIATEVRQGEVYRQISERFAHVWHSIGTHPNHAAKEPDVALDEVLAAAEHPKCVAIGEAGLDFHYDYAPRALQERSLRMQIEAARQSRLPLIVHARAADDAIGDLLEEEMGKGAFTAVLHCFSSGRRLAERGLALGFYISFSGILTFRSAQEIQDVARMAPAERILVETDAPFLAPVPHRGQRNEPGFCVQTARKLAELRETGLELLAPQLEANALRLFWKLGSQANP